MFKGIRSRNSKVQTGTSRDYPLCPRCGARTGPKDFKYNGDQDGEYFETFKCPVCPDTWFTATYDTSDDSGKWIVSMSRKIKGRVFTKWNRKVRA